MFWKTNPAPAAGGKNGYPSIVTRELHILGNVVSDGVLDFNGTIEGNIRCKTLTIREQGAVKGEVTAEQVMVYGKINGLIRAKHVHLFSTCHIEGIVMHESLTIEDGAFIDGKCKRTDKTEADEAESPLADIKIMDNIRLIR